MIERAQEMVIPATALTFLALAGLGWWFGQPPDVVAWRAAIAAAGVLALMRVGCRVLQEIPASATENDSSAEMPDRSAHKESSGDDADDQ